MLSEAIENSATTRKVFPVFLSITGTIGDDLSAVELLATMAEFSAEIVESVWAACQAGAGEIAGALSRTFDVPLQIEPGEQAKCGPSRLPDGVNAPALLIVMQVGDQAAVVVFPESTGLIPAWCANPDPTGHSKLATLAQELSMLCLPEIVMSDSQQTLRVDNAKSSLAAAGLVNDGALIPLHLRSGDEKRGQAWLVWPLKNPAGLVMSNVSSSAPAPAAARPAAKPAPAPVAPQPAPARPQPAPTSPEALPSYTRSLLKISVPVSVTLAQKKQPLGRIVELGVGSIIHFNKKCEEMLELEVNGQRVAQGEPVKVGDKFGLRVTGVTLPAEEFKPLAKRNA